ncbi:protein PRRC2C-like [Dermacentor silvarum]|uniref:protein PRRC2C-like n=1 Tax=Dermacentor silvarum TaxID=543639 RepID=UPI002100EE25|nr:protein PRRC2C-like [Dermacentor silvarum]
MCSFLPPGKDAGSVRKLSIDSRIMTSEEPGGFINFCWTSVTPVTVIALLSAKLIQGPLGEKRYPPFVEGAILWLEVVQVSFIPVYAVVLMLCTRLSLRDCLVPLPTWTPVNWELSMLYRQHLVAEGLDARQLEEKETASPSVPVSPTPSPSRPLSPLLESTSSSSGLLGTHLILTTEAKISPATSDWRYDSSDEGNAQPPVKWRSPPDKVVPRSGTFHKSLSLSAVWRAVRFNAASPKSARTKVPSHAPSHAPSPTSTPPHAALFVRDTSEVLATLPLVPRSDAGPTAPAVSPSPPLPANRAAREDSELLEELPVDSYVQVQADRAPGIPQQIQPPPQVLPSSCGQLPDAAAPSAVDTQRTST